MAVAWFRIGFACFIPYFFWSRGLQVDLSAIPDFLRGAAQSDLSEWITSTWYWILIALLSLAFGCGFRPRLTGVLLLLLLIPLSFLSRGMVSRSVFLFVFACFLILRSGEVRFPWRGAKGDDGSAGPSWPVRLIQIQLTVIYGVNAIAKTTPVFLRGDLLIDFSLVYPNFRLTFNEGSFEVAGLSIPVSILAVSAVLIEYFLAIAFWVPRLRWIGAFVGISFHVGLTFVLTIFHLHHLTIFLYLSQLLPLISRFESRENGPS